MVTINKSYTVETLPDLEMYGGDTMPWEMTLVQGESGALIPPEVVSECTATLSFAPFKATTGLGENAQALTPIVKKSGIVREMPDGSVVIQFDFAERDTSVLRGKFVYQIEVRYGIELRVCQGHILIKQNINRQGETE